ncbi:hypothetical protein FOE78_03725 [Microlunatus elymi]|uniref:Uncharacterized protein n=1 Tax=Microlunatus elymi TaxID=2596828 RepID=A0A516PVJ3_9ACTN|nr:hypothetical protein [Microlunatus elymi]QDP95142.1 hypothetical protein FOE78_03725 [Microlunatus elymi]
MITTPAVRPTTDRPDPTTSTDAAGSRFRALPLAVAAIAFGAYPILRGSGSEIGWTGAALYARGEWLLAHCLGMLGFVFLAWGLSSIDRWASRFAWAGAVLVLPYYGAEAFGLHALGQVALDHHDAAMIATADTFRYNPVAMTVFAAGLLALAACGLRMILLVRGSGSVLSRAGLALAGLCLIGYLPQFFAPIEARIIHGLLLGVGLLILAADLGRSRRTS